jgi:MATE family multidrug resistance protein
VLGIGLATAVSIQVAHAHGSGSDRGAADAFRHGIQVAVVLGISVWGLLILAAPHFHLLRQPPEVLAILPGYLHAVAASMAFMLPIMAMKSFAEAKNHPWPVFWIQLAGVGLNIGLNALLIFGLAGFPALGLTGAGIATLIARAATCAVMLVYLRRSRTLSASRPKRWLEPPRRGDLWEITKLSTPITAQMLMEYGAFATSALLIGTLGSLPMAAHQIAITCAATTYMLPMGLSGAVGIRVGHCAGAGALTRCRTLITGAQLMTVLIMGTFAVIYLTAGHWIARAFTTEPDLIVLTVALLSIAGMFQLFDGIQVVSVGALRALKDVRIPTLLSFIGYWILSFPLAVFLGFGLDRGVTGFWTGLGIGLAISAISMTTRLVIILRRQADIHPLDPGTLATVNDQNSGSKGTAPTSFRV